MGRDRVSRRAFSIGLGVAAGVVLSPRRGLARQVVDDVSRLNPVEVEELVPATSTAVVEATLARAADRGRRVAIAGARHSQGGYVATPGGIVLDMRWCNRVLRVDAEQWTIAVQPGATWDDVQRAANPLGLAVAVQQASNIFTVGGSVAVNCHGRDPRYGPIVDTVRSLTLMLADGRVVTATRGEHAALFATTVGGYGLTGVVVEIELQLEQDEWLEKSVVALPVKEFPAWLSRHVLSGPRVRLHFARPSIGPADLLERVVAVNYSAAADDRLPRAPLAAEAHVGRNKTFMALSRKSDAGKALRWYLQEAIVDRPGATQRLSRNNAMRPEVRFLDYRSPRDTDILQEYFVPLSAFVPFMARLRRTVRGRRINLLSATVRSLKRDQVTVLPYAPARDTGDMIAIVLYANIPRSESGMRAAAQWTREIVDVALSLDGTYYLPYQGWPTREQFAQAYPRAADFLAVKREYDPDGRFSNRLFEAYLAP
jgi:decaprenylphospho-beta-D-ribofuranose 2-oxidase